MVDEFGPAYAAVIERDLVLGDLSDQTAEQAMAAGFDLREIWYSICRSSGVPKERWHGVNKTTKKRHAEK
jgi:hypothetical protein